MSDEKGYLPWKDVKRLINVTDNNRDRMLLKTLAYSGRRVSEVVRGPPSNPNKQYGIRKCDLGEGNMVYFVILKKSKKRRHVVHLWGNLKRSLESFARPLGKEEYLFQITRQRAHQIIRKYGRRIGITHVGNSERNGLHCHHLRHSFAVHMARNLKTPADLRKLQMILKHNSIATTEQYLKFADTNTDIYGAAFE